jgi:hypothetical protein
MPLFGRKKSLLSLEKKSAAFPATAVPEAPGPPEILIDVNSVSYTIRSPWQWVLKKVANDMKNLTEVEKSGLPTSKMMAASSLLDTPVTDSISSRRQRKKAPAPCTLRIEIQDSDGNIVDAIHGTSQAFDGLEDKDELVRTCQRCRCEHLELSPPSRLINWDVTKEECVNLVGDPLPGLLANDKQEDRIAVLKEPMGSSGTGVFFVNNADEIHHIINEHRKRAVDEPELLDNLIARKGRIPSWGELWTCIAFYSKERLAEYSLLVFDACQFCKLKCIHVSWFEADASFTFEPMLLLSKNSTRMIFWKFPFTIVMKYALPARPFRKRTMALATAMRTLPMGHLPI